MESLKDKEKVAEIFRQVLDIYGLSLLRQTSRLNALLMDFMPRYDKERKFLMEAIKLGVAEELLNIKRKSASDVSYAVDRCKVRMETELLIKESVAEYTIDLLVMALNIVPPQSSAFIAISEEKARNGGIQKFNVRYNEKKYCYSVNIPAGTQDGAQIDIVDVLPGRSETGTIHVHIAVQRRSEAEKNFGGHHESIEAEDRNMAFIYHTLTITREKAQQGGRQDFVIRICGEYHHYFVDIPANTRSGDNIDTEQIMPGSSELGTVRVHIIVK